MTRDQLEKIRILLDMSNEIQQELNNATNEALNAHLETVRRVLNDEWEAIDEGFTRAEGD